MLDLIHGNQEVICILKRNRELNAPLPHLLPPSIMPLESRVDVLIIGAGPAGLMCATALAMAGVDVRIIDKRYGCHFPQSQC